MIHKEGKGTILITSVFLGLCCFFVALTVDSFLLKMFVYGSAVVALFFILQFFRNPNRSTIPNAHRVIAPADGTVVVIETVEETEVMHRPMKQISIFMSPLNVHVTRFPTSGTVTYSTHHKGSYLVASHPKSSLKNERTTVVLEGDPYGKILFRQVAGFVARRIINYAKVGDSATQGAEFGFIKFGSRMDIFLPLNSTVEVSLNQKVKGGETVIARFIKSQDGTYVIDRG